MGRKRTAQNDHPTRPQERNNRRRSISHPPTPKLPRQLVLRVGYVEDYFDPRTKLGIVFSRPLDKGGQRCIHDRMSYQPLQPFGHRFFLERSSIQANLDLELPVESDDADDG